MAPVFFKLLKLEISLSTSDVIHCGLDFPGIEIAMNSRQRVYTT